MKSKSSAPLYPRFSLRAAARALADTPVVLVSGPRQCGKTTLVRDQIAARGIKDGRVLEVNRAFEAQTLQEAVDHPPPRIEKPRPHDAAGRHRQQARQNQPR